MTRAKAPRRVLLVAGPLLLAALLVLFDDLFANPVAFLTGADLGTIKRAELAVLLGLAVLLAARFVRRDVVHGLLEARAGKALPLLLGDVAALVVVLMGATLILTAVYGRDVTALVATGGLGLAVLGIALRDVILAVFNGAALNIENAFNVGDRVRIGEVDGRVVQTTWRATTVLTAARRLVSVPNVALGTTAITNYDRPDKAEQRLLEISLDYDVTVESAERILLAGVLGAAGINHAAPPRVHAVKLERDGVLYQVRFTVADHGDALDADHLVIKSVLARLRDAGIGVAYPKQEVVNAERRVRVADRTLDRVVLVQQCALFHALPPDQQRAVAAGLVERRVEAGRLLVAAGETRPSIFVVGEGLLQRMRARPDRIGFAEERFVTTQFLGRRALLADLPHPGPVSAVTDSLVFEWTRERCAAFLRAYPDAAAVLADTLARPSALDAIPVSVDGGGGHERPRHARHFYLGQLHALAAPAGSPRPTDGELAQERAEPVGEPR